MLVMDGYGSHLIIAFINYCYQPNVKISVFLLPTHSTHILQPLDIGVFQSFKHYHQELLKESIWYSGINYKKPDFLASFQRMRNLTFKKSIICSAWRKSSLYPFDPSAVLTKLQEFSTLERTLVREDSGLELEFEVDFQQAVTPMSPRIYKAYASYIDQKLAWSIEHSVT
jgi:hypothetical protein